MASKDSNTDKTWIWLKDLDSNLADPPLPPLDDKDPRPLVKDLLAKYRKEVDHVIEGLKDDPLYVPTKHDDLWVLRFVMSHKGSFKKSVKAALKAAKHTLLFRKEHKLDERDIRYLTPGTDKAACPEMKEMLQYADDDTFLWCLPRADGPVVAFVRFKGYDQNALVGKVDKSCWLPTFVYLTEWAFQWIDYVTRKTGRLTKNVRLIDFKGMGMLEINREVASRDAAAMKVTEDCYPQLLQTILICHSAGWMQGLWRLLRPLMPRRTVEKVDFISPSTNDKERDRIFPHVPLDLLPERFGGNYASWPVEFPLPGES